MNKPFWALLFLLSYTYSAALADNPTSQSKNWGGVAPAPSENECWSLIEAALKEQRSHTQQGEGAAAADELGEANTKPQKKINTAADQVDEGTTAEISIKNIESIDPRDATDTTVDRSDVSQTGHDVVETPVVEVSESELRGIETPVQEEEAVSQSIEDVPVKTEEATPGSDEIIGGPVESVEVKEAIGESVRIESAEAAGADSLEAVATDSLEAFATDSLEAFATDSPEAAGVESAEEAVTTDVTAESSEATATESAEVAGIESVEAVANELGEAVIAESSEAVIAESSEAVAAESAEVAGTKSTEAVANELVTAESSEAGATDSVEAVANELDEPTATESVEAETTESIKEVQSGAEVIDGVHIELEQVREEAVNVEEITKGEDEDVTENAPLESSETSSLETVSPDNNLSTEELKEDVVSSETITDPELAFAPLEEQPTISQDQTEGEPALQKAILTDDVNVEFTEEVASESFIEEKYSKVQESKTPESEHTDTEEASKEEHIINEVELAKESTQSLEERTEGAESTQLTPEASEVSQEPTSKISEQPLLETEKPVTVQIEKETPTEEESTPDDVLVADASVEDKKEPQQHVQPSLVEETTKAIDESVKTAPASQTVKEEAKSGVIPVDVQTEEQSPEQEDLTLKIEIPENLRPRDHITDVLKLGSESVESEAKLYKTQDTILRELKRVYEAAIKPLEILYKYRDLSNRHFGDPEIFSKPLILFMGPWSGGKSSIINYLLDNEYKPTALRTGAEPSPAYFNIVMWGEREEVLDGTQLAADWTFSGLQKFGQGLLDRLRGLRLNRPLLEKVNIVEIPGILEIRKQVERLFPFNDACQWFIDRADIIFLVYDPSKLDAGPETEAILDQLKGREYQTKIVLNKADQVKPEELMRVQGTLIWNISPLMSSTEPPVMYSTSLWSHPYQPGSPSRLLFAQEKAFLKDFREAMEKRVENKISSARRFAVRVRNHAKMVDCYLTTYYNHKTFFGNKQKVSDDIIEHPQNYHIYEGLSTLTNISRYDLPDPDVYRDFFRLNPVYDFQQLSSTCTYFKGCPINRLDVAIAYDLPELIGKYRKQAEDIVKSPGKK